MAAALSLQGVGHSYSDEAVALHDVTLDVDAGVTALIGVNGAGKTTLLTVAAGGLRPTRGSVMIGGVDPYGRKSRTAALRHVALMPQTSSFPRTMSAREIVEYIAWMRGASARSAKAAAVRALDDVMLSEKADVRFADLSGGMQRRVCLAQAIACRPDVLLLDEPSTGLDPEQRRIMVDRLRQMVGAVILSSHVMEDVVDLAERVVILDSGAVVFSGTVTALTAMAPDPAGARAAEAGFLSVLAGSRGVS